MDIMILILGFILGEIFTGTIVILFTLYLNKSRVGVFIVPEKIKLKYRKMIREELKNE